MSLKTISIPFFFCLFSVCLWLMNVTLFSYTTAIIFTTFFLILPGLLTYWFFAPSESQRPAKALGAALIISVGYLISSYFIRIFLDLDIYYYLAIGIMATLLSPHTRSGAKQLFTSIRSLYQTHSSKAIIVFMAMMFLAISLQLIPGPGKGPVFIDRHPLSQTIPIVFLKDKFPLTHTSMSDIPLAEGYNTVFHLIGERYVRLTNLPAYIYSFQAEYIIFLPLFGLMGALLMAELGLSTSYIFYGILLLFFFNEQQELAYYPPQLCGLVLGLAFLNIVIRISPKPILDILVCAIGAFLIVGARLPVAACIISGTILFWVISFLRTHKKRYLFLSSIIAASCLGAYQLFFKFGVTVQAKRMGNDADRSYMLFDFIKADNWGQPIFDTLDHFGRKIGITQPFHSIILSLLGFLFAGYCLYIFWLALLPFIGIIWRDLRNHEKYGLAIQALFLCSTVGFFATCVINLHSYSELWIMSPANHLILILLVYGMSRVDLFSYLSPLKEMLLSPFHLFEQEKMSSSIAQPIIAILLLLYPFLLNGVNHYDASLGDRYRSSSLSMWLPYEKFERSALRGQLFKAVYHEDGVTPAMWSAMTYIRESLPHDIVVVAPELAIYDSRYTHFISALIERPAYVEGTYKDVIKATPEIYEEVKRRRKVLSNINETGFIDEELVTPKNIFLVTKKTAEKITGSHEIEELMNNEQWCVLRVKKGLQ